jgi:hypothetical protein
LLVQGLVQGPVQGPGRIVPAMTTTKRLHPALRPNASLPAYIDGNHPADQAARSKVFETWSRQWGTPDELVLPASSRGEARNLNLLARSALRRAGQLAGPSVTADDRELTPGDQVVIGRGGIGRPEATASPRAAPATSVWSTPPPARPSSTSPPPGGVRLDRLPLQRASVAYDYAVPAPPRVGRRVGGARLATPAHLGAEIA